jgi:hypothetical protein
MNDVLSQEVCLRPVAFYCGASDRQRMLKRITAAVSKAPPPPSAPAPVPVVLKVAPLPLTSMAFANMVFIAGPFDWVISALPTVRISRNQAKADSQPPALTMFARMGTHPLVAPGTVAMGGFHRDLLDLETKEVEVCVVPDPAPLERVDLEITVNPCKLQTSLDADLVIEAFLKQTADRPVLNGQRVVLDVPDNGAEIAFRSPDRSLLVAVYHDDANGPRCIRADSTVVSDVRLSAATAERKLVSLVTEDRDKERWRWDLRARFGR